MRTTIDLPDALFRKLKARAALQGRSMKDYLTARLRHDLETIDSAETPPGDWLMEWDTATRAIGRSRKGKQALSILSEDRNAR